MRKGRHFAVFDKRAGFTLVELLVVISIIALLLSILMPALNKARENGRTSVCLNNVRRMAVSVLLYSNENSGYMMYALTNGVTWMDYLYTHEDNKRASTLPESTKKRTRFHCPSEPAHGAYTPKRGPYQGDNMWTPFGDYALNRGGPEPMCGEVQWVTKKGWVETSKCGKLSSVTRQSERFLVVDSENYNCDAALYWWRNPITIRGYVWAIDSRHNGKHSELDSGLRGYISQVQGKPNMGFVDGHAERHLTEMPPYTVDRGIPPW